MALVEINWHPARRQLRAFGLACMLALAALGAWVCLRRGLAGFELGGPAAVRLALGLWFAAGISGALAVLAPSALWPAYAGLSLVALPIGTVLGYGLLGLLYYGVFTPVALVFRIVGRDALRRRFDPDAETYWVRRGPADDVSRYFRQS
jgi:hypothetical protein